ncbi:ATP-binding protein [Vibrio makurazakiensis]|uniref:ATP-binding protein n=1 Tax=Vibrio makurazakiensis TaxID=2910250 RepID=UPI003D0A4AAA
MSLVSALEQKIAREIAARKEAERLLEKKSLELFEANQSLELALKQLEKSSKENMKRIEFQAQVDMLLIEFGGSFLRESLDEVMLSNLTKQITKSYFIESSRLFLPPGLLPELNKTDFGDPTLAKVDFSCLKPVWKDDELHMALIVERKAVGSLIVKVNLSGWEKDKELIVSQLSLVTDLICGAVTHQLSRNRNNESRRRAEESERSTREFVAMINHELRTPLNGLLGSAELLSDTELTVHQQEMVGNLTQSGELLRVIINDLLDYSKMNAGMLELIENKFPLANLRNTLNGIFVNQASEKRIGFTIDVESDVPHYFFGDLERVTQIFVNLIGNAIKFTEYGEVKVMMRWQFGVLKCSVEDTGIGIPENSIENLFLPFTQSDRSSSRNYEGTGLGLAICKQLVGLMDGSISVTSSVGKGTKFSIDLPLKELSESRVHANVESDIMSEVGISLLQVLVVDDINMNQIIIQQMLGKIDITPDCAENGIEGMKYALEHYYDIIFMDCRMPLMDGFEATRQLRDGGYTRPIIALTAGTTIEEREKCIESGMDDILSKPYTAEDLREMLKKWG